MKRELNKLLKRTDPKFNKSHKFGAQKTKCLHGHTHDSKKEAMWCVKIHQMKREGKVSFLEVQPEYDLVVNGKLICRHRPDFSYINNDPCGRCKPTVVDVKGVKTPDWSIKHKLFCALYSNHDYLVV